MGEHGKPKVEPWRDITFTTCMGSQQTKLKPKWNAPKWESAPSHYEVTKSQNQTSCLCWAGFWMKIGGLAASWRWVSRSRRPPLAILVLVPAIRPARATPLALLPADHMAGLSSKLYRPHDLPHIHLAKQHCRDTGHNFPNYFLLHYISVTCAKKTNAKAKWQDCWPHASPSPNPAASSSWHPYPP